MKLKITKKAMRGEEIYRVGYCKLQHLLRDEQAFAYSAGVYGWACDYYKVGDIYISTGYSPIGKAIDSELVRKYEKMARAITGKSYEQEKAKRSKLLERFLSEIKKGQ